MASFVKPPDRTPLTVLGGRRADEGFCNCRTEGRNDPVFKYQHYMIGAELKRFSFDPNQLGDHDHCIMCGAKFSKNPEDEKEGYITLDQKYIVCDECFREYKEEYRFCLSDTAQSLVQ